MEINIFFNKNGQYHRLTGPAVERWNGGEEYYINGILYMFFDSFNKLYINPNICKLNPEYEIYIKQNIKNLIKEYNPNIELGYDFYIQKGKLNKNYLKKSPDWLKNLILL